VRFARPEKKDAAKKKRAATLLLSHAVVPGLLLGR
jgi:hypothetical protein